MRKTKTNKAEVEVLPHQTRLLMAPWWYPERDFHFMVAGYNAGKSYSGVLAAVDIEDRYHGKPINVGIGGPTLIRLRQTLIMELEKHLNTYGIGYEQNKQENTLTINAAKFTLIGMDNPGTIYAHNFNAFLGDELEEISDQVKGEEAFKAVQERTRVPFPDGHEAFSTFFTTAQGYHTIYKIIEDMKEKGDPYYLIHARSRDNRFISKRWLRKMERIYTEIERRVYLDGEFANLTTGRVYYGYDEDKHRLKSIPFTIEPNDLIRVGQDFNFGYSDGTAIVKREGKLYVCKLWEFHEIGHAAKMIRTDFPNNEIEWYPDATAPEIVAGIAKEFRNYDIQIRMGTVNPSVVDRIFFVNHLFEAMLLYLFPNCGPLSMALKLRQFDDKGNPEKGKGPTAPDHRCFAAGTMIATTKGEKAIETVKVGDYVLTRQGPRIVVASGMTGIERTGKYRGLTCTPDHPVWTQQGWKPARLLTRKDILCKLSSGERQRCENIIRLLSSFRALPTDDIQTQSKNPITSTIDAHTDMAKRGIFTVLCGLRRTGVYPLVARFTTSTATPLTTTPPTSNVFRFVNIELRVQNIITKCLQNRLQAILLKPEKRQRHGMVVQRAADGILKMLGFIRLPMKSLIEFAKSAVRDFVASTRVLSVPRFAFQGIGAHQERTTRAEHVRGAVIRSRSIGIQERDAVQDRADASGEVIVPVYNLSVEDAHEYYANGVLVSNCDSLEYAVWRIVSRDQEFTDLWTSSRIGRKTINERQIT
jgi:hypothetical protein